MKPLFTVLLMGLLSWLLGCGSDSPYNQKDGKWYFKKDALSLEPEEMLTPLNKHFAKSKSRAFFESSWMGEVDISTFEALSDHYAKDKNFVWYCDTYRDGKEYWTVKRYRTPRIAGADAPSFRMLSSEYARDTNAVYHDGASFPVRDINTYERLGDAHARDRVSGYFMRSEIKGSEGSTFSEVNAHYSKDAKHVFYSDYSSGKGAHSPVEVSMALPGADPATFTALEYFYARDAIQAYYQGKVVAKAVSSFRVLDHGYAIGDSLVLYQGEVLKGADAATFQVIEAIGESATAQDKHGKFNYAERIKQ